MVTIFSNGITMTVNKADLWRFLEAGWVVVEEQPEPEPEFVQPDPTPEPDKGKGKSK